MIEKRRNDKVFERITDAKARKQILDVIEKHDLLKATCENLAFWGRRLSTASPERIRQAAVEAYFSRYREVGQGSKKINEEKERSFLTEIANSIGRVAVTHDHKRKEKK